MLLIAALLIAQTLDSGMTSQEKKQTGVYKLNDVEKSALQQWVDNRYTKRNEPLKPAPQEHGTLQENLKNGHYISLDNGTLWNIHPKDTPITQGWITPVDITVTTSGDPEYPYKLTNSLTGSSVRAKKVQSVPPSPPQPAAPVPAAPATTKPAPAKK